jgi:hypothetical protein
MFTLRVLAISASKKSVLAVVNRPVGIFNAAVATGSIALTEGAAIPSVGSEFPLEGITSVKTRESIAEDGTVFNWLVLE